MNRMLLLRFLLLPMIIVILLISIFFTVRGIWICNEVVSNMVSAKMSFELISDQTDNEPPVLIIMEAVDSFLLSFVFFIFSFGLYKLFFVKESSDGSSRLPAWLDIHSILDLKTLLWQSILTTLVMLFLNYAVWHIAHKSVSWDILLIPGSILLISIALYFMKLSEKHS